MIGLETKRNKMRRFWEVEIEREIKMIIIGRSVGILSK